MAREKSPRFADREWMLQVHDEAIQSSVPVNVTRIAENAAAYLPCSKFERDVADLVAMIEVAP